MWRSRCFQKLDDLRAADRPRKQAEVEIPPRHSRHRRQHLPVEVIVQHWRLSPWRPGPAAVWALASSAFVDEDDSSPLVLGFFLISGQRCCFHCRIFSRPVPAPVLPDAGSSNPVAAKSARPARGGTSPHIPARSDQPRATKSTGWFRSLRPPARASVSSRCAADPRAVTTLALAKLGIENAINFLYPIKMIRCYFGDTNIADQ